MKKLITLFAIVALLGSCKKEENKAPTTTTIASKLFVVELQSTEPQGTFFGYNLYLNGNSVASPITVVNGDAVKVVVYNSLGNAYVLKCFVDNVNMYPNANYQYSDVTWNYTIN